MDAGKKETGRNGEGIAFEIRRQAFHIAFGTASALLFSYGIAGWKFFAAVLAAGMIMSAASKKYRIPPLSWFLDMFERPSVALPGKGALSLMAGILMAVFLFEKSTALAAIMVVTLGDSLSHISGKLFGKRKHPLNRYKLIEGTAVGILFGAAGAAIFVHWAEALAAATAAMLVESIELKMRKFVVDDNLVVPLVAGAVITAMRAVG